MGTAGSTEAGSHSIGTYVSGLVGIGAGLLSGILYVTGNSIFYYPSITAAIASGLYAVAQLSQRRHGVPQLSSRQLKIAQIAGFVLITALIILGWMSGAARPQMYFVGYLVTVLIVLVVGITRTDWVVLTQVILLLFATRLELFRAAPVIGVDTTLHQATVGYILTTGELAPRAVSYYYWYPVSHVSSATLGVITGLSAKLSLFMTVSATAILAALLVFLLGKHLAPRSRSHTAGFVSICLVLVSWPHLDRTAIPIAQTLNLTLVASVLYLLTRNRTLRIDALLVGLLFLIGATHVLAPIILSGLLFGLLLYDWCHHRWSENDGVSSSRVEGYLLLSVLAVYTFQYFISTGKLALQIGRISVLLTAGGTLSGAVEETTGSMLQTDILFSTDPLLLFAGSLLVIGALVTISVYDFLDRLFARELHFRQDRWLFTGSFLFAGFTISLVAGFGSHISRGLAAAVLLVAPVAGIAGRTLVTEWGSRGVVALIAILTVGAYLGIASPATAIPERSNGFQPMLTESEVAVIEFVDENGIQAVGHPYIAARAKDQRVATGQLDWPIELMYAGYPPPENLFERYERNHSSQPFVHRTFYEQRRGIEPPSDYRRVYDSGKATIVIGIAENRRAGSG